MLNELWLKSKDPIEFDETIRREYLRSYPQERFFKQTKLT